MGADDFRARLIRVEGDGDDPVYRRAHDSTAVAWIVAAPSDREVGGVPLRYLSPGIWVAVDPDGAWTVWRRLRGGVPYKVAEGRLDDPLPAGTSDGGEEG